MSALRYSLLAALVVTLAACDSTSPGDGVDGPAPENLRITASDFSSITIAWSDRSDGESGFVIERTPWDRTAGFSTDPVVEAWEAIATVGPDVETYTDTDLAGAGRWAYRIRVEGNETETSLPLRVQPRELLRIGEDGAYSSASLNLTGDALVVGSSAGSQIYTPETGRLEHTSAIAARYALPGDGCYAARRVGVPLRIVVFDAELDFISEPTSEYFDFTLSRDCSRVAIALRDEPTVVVHDAQTGAVVSTVTGVGKDIVLSDDGSVLYASTTNAAGTELVGLGAWNTSDASAKWSLALPRVTTLALEGGELRVGASVILVLDPETGAELRPWPGAIQYTARTLGPYVVETGFTERVSIYRRSDAALLRTVTFYAVDGRRVSPSSVSAALHADGLRLAMRPRLNTVSPTEGAYVLDLSGWEAVRSEVTD